MQRVSAVEGRRIETPRQPLAVQPPCTRTMLFVETPSLRRRIEFRVITLENMKWKAPGIVAVLASDTSAPRVILIKTRGDRGRIIRKWRSICLVSNELRYRHALTGHHPDSGTSPMEHPNSGSVRSPVQLDGIFTCNQQHRPSAVMSNKIRRHLLHCPQASAALSPQLRPHGLGVASCSTRENDPDFTASKIQGFIRRSTDDGTCTRSSSSGVIARTHAIRRLRSSSLRPNCTTAASAPSV